MKRFFCPACSRIRRARNLPPKTTKNIVADKIVYEGLCVPHTLGLTRAINVRVENPKTPRILKSKSVAVASVKKGKR